MQAAIAAEHARAPSFAETDWAAVVDRYGLLLSVDPAPIHALGRCLARSYLFGPAVGLADLDEVLALPRVGDRLRADPIRGGGPGQVAGPAEPTRRGGAVLAAGSRTRQERRGTGLLRRCCPTRPDPVRAVG